MCYRALFSKHLLFTEEGKVVWWWISWKGTPKSNSYLRKEVCFMERLCFCLSLLGCQDDSCVEIVWTNEVKAGAQQEQCKLPRGYGFAELHEIRFQRSAMLKRYWLKIKSKYLPACFLQCFIAHFCLVLHWVKGSLYSLSVRSTLCRPTEIITLSSYRKGGITQEKKRLYFLSVPTNNIFHDLAVSAVDWRDCLRLLKDFFPHFPLWGERRNEAKEMMWPSIACCTVPGSVGESSGSSTTFLTMGRCCKGRFSCGGQTLLCHGGSEGLSWFK